MYVIELCLAKQLKFMPTIKTVKPTYIYKSMIQVCNIRYSHLSNLLCYITFIALFLRTLILGVNVLQW